MLATAGEGYAYYIERSWQITFDSPALLRTGNTITVGGERVAMLPTGYSGKPEEHTCNVAAGRSIYVDGIGDECSTIHGDHARFGTTDSDRTRCPRAMYVGGHASGTASIDGRPVANQAKTIVATGVYAVHVPKNIFGTKRRSGRSAVYGEAVLLSGSSRGTHVIHLTGSWHVAADVSDTVELGWFGLGARLRVHRQSAGVIEGASASLAGPQDRRLEPRTGHRSRRKGPDRGARRLRAGDSALRHRPPATAGNGGRAPATPSRKKPRPRRRRWHRRGCSGHKQPRPRREPRIPARSGGRCRPALHKRRGRGRLVALRVQ